MAFDRPIEADRIDDFNLFSAFVRAPLWILGGVLGSSAEDDKDDCSKKNDICSLSSQQSPGIGGPSRVRVVSNEALALHSSPAIDGAGPADQLHRVGECSVEWHSSADDPGPRGLKRGKNLSWSDESGRSLVEFNDESVRHEPSPYHAATTMTGPKPKKSSLRRSRSIRSSADESSGLGPSTDEKTRYIPKMNKSEGGLIMPTRPYGSNPPGGVESPQWGWYINTTPPTPDMYQSHNAKILKQANRPAPSSQPIQSQHMDGAACHNQVFQNLQNSNRQMGWTSVPI